MKTNTDLFEKTPVPKAVATMAVPTMISMLVVVIYNMADTFFIGQTKDPLQVAAVSLATPVFMIFMALGHLFGIGGSSAISRALGERHKDRACHISSFCCYGSLGLGVIVAILSVLGMETYFRICYRNRASLEISCRGFFRTSSHLYYFIDFSLLFFENFRNFSLHIRSPPLLFCCPSITKQSGGSIWLL